MSAPERLRQQKPDDSTDLFFASCPSCTFHFYDAYGKEDGRNQRLPPLDADYQALCLGYETFENNDFISGIEYLRLIPAQETGLLFHQEISPLQKEMFSRNRTLYFGTLLQEKDLPRYRPAAINAKLFVPSSEDWLCRTRSGRLYYLTPDDIVVMAQQTNAFDRFSGKSYANMPNPYEGYIVYLGGPLTGSKSLRTKLVDKFLFDQACQKTPQPY